MAEMEDEMLANPGYWQSHCRGEPDSQRVLRISATATVSATTGRPRVTRSGPKAPGPLDQDRIPKSLISQFLPTLYPRVASGL